MDSFPPKVRILKQARRQAVIVPGNTDDQQIQETLGELLREANHTVSVAESCTGGLVGSLLTDVPGSSEYFERGYITYANDAKLDIGVAREVLDEHGAVSDPAARQMARAVRDSAGTTWGLSTTGIAGPGGGTETKPVGMAFVGVAFAGKWGTKTSYAVVDEFEFDGDRTEIKAQTARCALTALARELGAMEK